MKKFISDVSLYKKEKFKFGSHPLLDPDPGFFAGFFYFAISPFPHNSAYISSPVSSQLSVTLRKYVSLSLFSKAILKYAEVALHVTYFAKRNA